MAHRPLRGFLRRRGVSRLAGVVLAAAVVSGAAAGTGRPAAACSLDTGETAVLVRALQSHLMVAGLSCGQSAQYNQFVTTFQSDLVRHGQSLTRHYGQQYGGAGKRELNAAVTRMANEASQRSMTDRRGFCAESAAIFATLMATPGQDLVGFITAQAPFTLAPPACETRTAQK